MLKAKDKTVCLKARQESVKVKNNHLSHLFVLGTTNKHIPETTRNHEGAWGTKAGQTHTWVTAIKTFKDE